MNQYPPQIKDASDMLVHYFRQAGVDVAQSDVASEIRRIPEMIYDAAYVNAVLAAKGKP